MPSRGLRWRRGRASLKHTTAPESVNPDSRSAGDERPATTPRRRWPARSPRPTCRSRDRASHCSRALPGAYSRSRRSRRTGSLGVMPSRLMSLADPGLLVDRRVLPVDVGRPARADAGLPARPARRSPSPATRPGRCGGASRCIDDPEHADDRRTVGEAVTVVDAPGRRLVRDDEPGRVRRGGLLRGTPLATRASVRARDREPLPRRPLGQPPDLRPPGRRPRISATSCSTVTGRLHERERWRSSRGARCRS